MVILIYYPQQLKDSYITERLCDSSNVYIMSKWQNWNQTSPLPFQFILIQVSMN